MSNQILQFFPNVDDFSNVMQKAQVKSYIMLALHLHVPASVSTVHDEIQSRSHPHKGC